MTPFQEAAEHWNRLRTPISDTFGGIVEKHAMRGGYVLATPHFFMLGRPVRSVWTTRQLATIDLVAHPSRADCWYVYLAAGDLREMVKAIPYPLPFVAFHRNRSTKKVVVPSRYLLARIPSRQQGAD